MAPSLGSLRRLTYALALALTGALPCAAATGGASLVTITDKNSGQAIAISVGQSLSVRLPSNPTTGYEWTAAPLHAGPLTQLRAPAFEAPASGRLGAGGTEVFSYRGVAAGTAHLTFSYARSWEHAAPARRVAVTVVVRSRP
jgi:inhibitor of cysteine peptidase